MTAEKISYNKTITVQVPQEFLDQIDEHCNKTFIGRSSYIRSAVMKDLREQRGDNNV